ncbi:hypothetical protein ACN28E_28865 [Archangium lansingense]|uniref:hypothetical protein n=1 Tax=Archangium lansingense TaxID=2995310 RepID=UPI003B7EC7CE
MCDSKKISAEISDWFSFTSVAQIGKKGFGPVPAEPGVYVLRVAAIGAVDPTLIKETYLKSDFMQVRTKLDKESEAFFKNLGLGEGWGTRIESYSRQRLERLTRLELNNGVLGCPVIYIGKANSLRRRMEELACAGHTANDPVWALLLSNWQLEIGIRTVSRGLEKSEEERLKDIYRTYHGGRLPALVDR